jgi:hypothetical protein
MFINNPYLVIYVDDVPYHHGKVKGNFVDALTAASLSRGNAPFWMPACAGMTVEKTMIIL